MKRMFQSIFLGLSIPAFCYTAFVAVTYCFPQIVDFDDAFFFVNMWVVPLSSLAVIAGSLICTRGGRVPLFLRIVSIATLLFFTIFLLFIFFDWPFPYYWLVFRYQALVLSVLLLAWVIIWIKIKRADAES